jgi:hypothetical protein
MSVGDHKMLRRTVYLDLKTFGHDEFFEPVPPAHSTPAMCGSREKVEVMRQRVLDGEDLFHPGDNSFGVAQYTDQENANTKTIRVRSERSVVQPKRLKR